MNGQRESMDGMGTSSGSYLTARTPSEVERLAYESFVRTQAAPQYREQLAHLYDRWHAFNRSYFEEKLRPPHIGVGLTTPRRLSQCRLTTNYGGAMDITLGERAAFGLDRRLVREPWPSQGLTRFLDDLVLGETVKQFVLELKGSDEDGYGGYGPIYAAEATRIGESLGLPPVTPRRRGFRGAGQPVAAFWPWAFRPDGYYLGHVRFDHIRVAGLRSRPVAVRQSAVPGMLEYFLFLLTTGQVARLTEILGREVDATKEAKSPALAAAERNPQDASGMPLPMPVIDPMWLTWNAGCVRAIAEGIRTRRAFDGMPILADALQDAGCEDQVLLGHLRAHTDHTANCFALRLLTEPT